MTAVIRPATVADVAAITAIFNEAIRTTTAVFYLEERTLEQQRDWFAQHDERHPILVAEVSGEVVGWASLSAWSDRGAYAGAAETTMYVRAADRGRGIGRLLKRAILDHARTTGHRTLIAQVAEGSDVSRYLNESFGFRHVGTLRRIGRKFERDLDVDIFQLHLEPATDPAEPRS